MGLIETDSWEFLLLKELAFQYPITRSLLLCLHSLDIKIGVDE